MTTFLLPCECTADVAVNAGQAGGNVVCPRCGRRLSVPKLRDLGRLRRQESALAARGVPWRPAQAVALVGSIIAVGAWLASLWFAPQAAGAIDERSLRSAVLSADDMAIYTIWTEVLAKTGVRRPPSDEENALLRRSGFADGVRSILHLVAGCGAVAAGIAAAMLWCTPKPKAAGRSTTRVEGRE